MGGFFTDPNELPLILLIGLWRQLLIRRNGRVEQIELIVQSFSHAGREYGRQFLGQIRLSNATRVITPITKNAGLTNRYAGFLAAVIAFILGSLRS